MPKTDPRTPTSSAARKEPASRGGRRRDPCELWERHLRERLARRHERRRLDGHTPHGAGAAGRRGAERRDRKRRPARRSADRQHRWRTRERRDRRWHATRDSPARINARGVALRLSPVCERLRSRARHARFGRSQAPDVRDGALLLGEAMRKSPAQSMGTLARASQRPHTVSAARETHSTTVRRRGFYDIENPESTATARRAIGQCLTKNWAPAGPLDAGATRLRTGRSPSPVGLRFQAFAGFRASRQTRASGVAGAGFEPATFGL
jgi:hypothetical protein